MKKIYAVGIGPGRPDQLTPQALTVLRNCTTVAGYDLYLELIRPLLDGKRRISGGMRQELQRCRAALDATLAGETVAVIGSGDAGIYGMAGLLLELTELPPYAGIEVEVIPGVTSAVAAAALAGAPLMNDFAVISLSDLMTPKEKIIRRIEAAAAADLVTALYNPCSVKRRELLPLAVEIFRAAGGDLPGVLVRDCGRPDQLIRTFRLAEFPLPEVQMTTVVIIGNSETVLRKGRLYSRRGYKDKYGLEE